MYAVVIKMGVYLATLVCSQTSFYEISAEITKMLNTSVLKDTEVLKCI